VVITGGEPCPPETIRRFRDRWPDKQLIDAYGLTEGGLIALANTDDMDRKPGSVGRAAQAQSFRIVTPDGELAVPGETGEIWTASPTVIPGYWNAPELTSEALVDGWLRTGDLGHVDQEGYLYIDGRVRDMIISKGQNIFPAEVEAVLRVHDAVQDCAVVGVPDADFGEAVCAVIVVRPGHALTESEVVAVVRDRIASYKQPRHVVFRDSLPLSVNNKVLKRELAQDVAASLHAASAAGL
jgi:fatty-acyl-CoA synthase